MEVQLIKTCVRIVGREHPHRLISMNNLAMTYRDQGTVGGGRRANGVGDGGKKDGASARASRYADQHEQSCVNVSGLRTIGEYRRSGHASDKDEGEGVRAGTSRYAD